MKKSKIIGIIVISVVVIGLIVFASTYKFSDSHLRSEGVRVRVGMGAMYVDGCEEDSVNAIYCKKIINVSGEDQILEFEFLNFRENGYPDAIRATINGKEFYFEEGLNIEENGSIDYRTFLNFYVMNDEVIVYTLTRGTNGLTTTLYAIDLEGNTVLADYNIDEDNMLIRDYSDFITFEDNTMTIHATRVENDVNYEGESVCNADDDAIVEGYYTYTYHDHEFRKEQTRVITAKEFIDDKGIICANKED